MKNHAATPQTARLAVMLVLLVGMLYASSAKAETILMIDNYTHDFGIDTLDANPNSESSTTVSGTMNGDRITYIENLSETGYIQTYGGVGIYPTGVYVAQVNPTARGLWRLTYGSQLPLNIDLTQFGLGKFVLTDFTPDLAGIGGTVTITLESTGGTASLEQVVLTDDPADMDFVFSDFDTFDSFSWMDVQSIDVELLGTVDGDYGWFDFYAIPEPASVLLFGAGVMLVISRTRRAKA